MDPTAEEQLDYEEDEYGHAQKMQYQGGGAIPALADDDVMGEDDEYDDLYNDVNVGEGFLQLQCSEPPDPQASFGTKGLQAHETDIPGPPQTETAASPRPTIPGISTEGIYSYSEMPQKGDHGDGTQKGGVLGITHDMQVQQLNFNGPAPAPQRPGISNLPGKNASEPVPLMNSIPVLSRAVPQMLDGQTSMNVNVNVNLNHPMAHPAVDTGETTLFVGELHWWTTDAELESALSQYGRVKEIKFFDERASGKSKGYCQVEFFDSAAAAVCKEGMNGYVFNGRACVVTFASPQTLKQAGASYLNKTQGQSQTQGRRSLNDGPLRGGANYGRGGWGRGGQGMLSRGPSGGPRGRGVFGGKSNVGVGSTASVGGYGQGIGGPAFGSPMHPQGMMGGGIDASYMTRGFSSPAFPGMFPSFPNSMGLAGVAPHVNPAFFGRGMPANGMGMMGGSGIDGHQAAMWTEAGMGGWGGDDHGPRTLESSYGADDGASEYGYGEFNHDKGGRSNAASRDRDRDEREPERDRTDRDHRYREERDSHEHRQRERDLSNDRSRSRSRGFHEEDRRSRSRDVDYGKRKRFPSE